MRTLQVDIQRQETTISKLKDTLEEATPQTGVLEELERQLAEHAETKKINENQYQDIVNEKDRLNAEQREKKTEMDAVQEEIDEINTRIEKAKSRLQKLQDRRQDVVRAKNEVFARLEDAQREKINRESELDHREKEVQDFTTQAELVSPRIRVDPGETATSIEAKLDRLNEEKERHVRAYVLFLDTAITYTDYKQGGWRHRTAYT